MLLATNRFIVFTQSRLKRELFVWTKRMDVKMSELKKEANPFVLDNLRGWLMEAATAATENGTEFVGNSTTLSNAIVTSPGLELQHGLHSRQGSETLLNPGSAVDDVAPVQSTRTGASLVDVSTKSRSNKSVPYHVKAVTETLDIGSASPTHKPSLASSYSLRGERPGSLSTSNRSLRDQFWAIPVRERDVVCSFELALAVLVLPGLFVTETFVCLCDIS